MTEKPITAHPLAAAWTALGRRLAVAGAALAALLSLLTDTPVWVASLRGALTWFAITAVVRLCARLQVASIGPEPERTARKS
ncbi:MAG: hypothetical protein FJ294_00225 [Planctomycetes bacterium]|nr:hypothetical protein [Planctomycetota bacterium]MBM3991036.1 hypothetical protein [Planctomycetota bacterium]